MQNPNITKKQLLNTIDDLSKNPNDKIRILGDIGISCTGFVMGALSAGTLAAAAGATTITGISTMASWIGLTVLAPTPIGWVIGAGVLGSTITYGLARLIHNGAMSEGRKQELLETYKERLQAAKQKERMSKVSDNDRTRFIQSLRELIATEVISAQKAFELIYTVESGKMSISTAYQLVCEIMMNNTTKSSADTTVFNSK